MTVVRGTDVILYDPDLAKVPPAPPPRPRVLVIGTVLASGAVVGAFAGLLALWVSIRSEVRAEGLPNPLPEGAEVPLTPATMSLITLSMSAVMISWAFAAIAANDRSRSYLAMLLTAVLGAAHCNAIAFLWSQVGFGIRDPNGALFYAITAGHLAVTLAGIVFIGLMAFRTLGGQYSGKDREGVLAAAVFWYAVVAIYVPIWLVVYIGS